MSESQKHDAVNHPSHYCREGSMECIDEMILLFGKEEDMQKSDWYINKYKELCDTQRPSDDIKLGYTE